MSPQPAKTRLQEFAAALGEHFYRAELIAYGSLLTVGVVQIVIRERFPHIHPPWPLIAGALVVVLLGVLFVPPILLLIRARKKPDSHRHEP